jgi:hypothetical protein
VCAGNRHFRRQLLAKPDIASSRVSLTEQAVISVVVGKRGAPGAGVDAVPDDLHQFSE